jgi:hypothetical protein
MAVGDGMLDFPRNENKTNLIRNGWYGESAGTADEEISMWNAVQIV